MDLSNDEIKADLAIVETNIADAEKAIADMIANQVPDLADRVAYVRMTLIQCMGARYALKAALK